MTHFQGAQTKATGANVFAAALFMAVTVVLTSSAIGQDSYNLQRYASDCAKMIANAPVFNCQNLDLVPITVNGKTPDTYTRDMKCDRPALLPYPKTSDGQCTPYSRIKAVRDDDIQMVLACRRMFIRPVDDPNFDSFEIIMHNVKSGSTCFFISKNFGGKPEGENGNRVPPPSELKPPKGEVSAAEIWATPQQTADHGCIYCHDSDPWMRTPWVDQIGQVPSNPWGFYAVDVGGPFAKWPKPKSVATRGNTCVGCHRIGSLNTCRTMDIPTFGEQPAKMLQAIGRAPHGKLGARPGTVTETPPDVYSQWAATYPHSAWMPLGNELPYAEWRRIYHQDVKELERCCNNPKAAGCIVSPIQSLQSWLGQRETTSPKKAKPKSRSMTGAATAEKQTSWPIDTGLWRQ